MQSCLIALALDIGQYFPAKNARNHGQDKYGVPPHSERIFMDRDEAAISDYVENPSDGKKRKSASEVTDANALT